MCQRRGRQRTNAASTTASRHAESAHLVQSCIACGNSFASGKGAASSLPIQGEAMNHGWLIRVLLRLYPEEFRARYGREMLAFHHERMERAPATTWPRIVGDHLV